MSKINQQTLKALKILGHTVEDCQESVYRHHRQLERLWNGEPASKIYREIFGPNNPDGYTACCDMPGNVLWESLLEEFPDAKGFSEFIKNEKNNKLICQ